MKKIALVLSLVAVFACVNVASALTVDELMAQIATLQAQIATLSGASVDAASSVPTITSNLTIGSKGAQVTDLQKYLEDEGYLVMPAGVDYGYFGPLTKSAVIEWQKANDVTPASGYFGPISREALDDLRVATPIGGTTPAGDLCPNGMTLASNCTVAPVGGVTVVAGLDNTDGSISAALGALAPTTQTLKKGDSDKPVYGIRFTATGGKVNVNRIDVHFTDRPWLIFSNVTIKDASGNVLATKVLTGPSDVTMAIENSDYYVRFDNLSLVVTPGVDTNVVVTVSVPASNSFVGTSPYDATTVGIQTNSIRTINGRGIYDTVGIDAVGSGNTITLTTSGSAADLSVTLDGASPDNGTQVYVAAAGGTDTTNVPLAVYSFRSVNQDSTISSLAFTVATDPGLGSNLGSSMKIFKLSDGSNSYFGSLSGSTVTFTINPGLVLTKDISKKFTLSADIQASSTAFAASTTLDVSAISATDANYVTPTYGGNTMSDVTSDVIGGNLTFTNQSASVSGMSVTSPANSSPVTVANTNNAYAYADVLYTFSLTNTGVNDIYLSKVLGVALGTTTVATNASSTIHTWGNIAGITGDTDDAYRIQPGSLPRTFSVHGTVAKRDNLTTSEQLNINSINYGATAASPTGSSISTGLEPLSFYGSVVILH